MARTAEGAALTRQHRQRQLGLRAAVLRDLATIWPLWRIDDADSYDRFVAAATTLVRTRHRDSAGIAARYYQAFRDVEGVGGEPTPRLAGRPPAAKVASSLYSTGLAGSLRAVKGGMSPQAARRNGLVRVSGAVGRQVLDGGRRTIVESSRSDREAVGWARMTGGRPCAFCAMVASRGPVFSTSSSADFEAHDHCACEPEPHYEGAEWPGRAREFREMWDRAQGEAREAGELGRGTSNDALNAFRRSLET